MFVLTTASWVSISGFASLPLVLGVPQLSFTNAVFESVSAITTTGSTILVNIEELSDGLKLWRGIMQWLGGIGIIVMAIAILPFLKVGGMRLFHTESSDWSDKVMPRTGGIAKATLSIYMSFTLAATAAYWLGGMSLLDAVVHAMTSMATGGFANSDASFGAYADQPLILWMASFFFFLTISGLALSLSALGLDFTTALTGAATAVANIGPGLGDTIGPSGNFAPLPDAAKWLLCVGMLMGRLEILTVLVLLTPMFWRK